MAIQGYLGVLKYGTAGTTANLPTPSAQDVTLNVEDEELEANRRGGGGFKEWIGGLRTISIEFEMILDETAADYIALQAAHWSRTPKSFLGLMSDEGQGPDFDGLVTKFSPNQPVGGVQTVSVSIKPTKGRVPAWYSEEEE